MTNSKRMENQEVNEEDLRSDAELNLDRFAEALVRENLINNYDDFGVLYSIYRNAQFEELSYVMKKALNTL